MTDKELLELAAKAAGIEVIRSRLDDPLHTDILIKDSPRNPYQQGGQWNPLTDDGDALRLAVRLDMGIEVMQSLGESRAGDGDQDVVHEPHKDDQYAATRRAIVRAAAEISKSAG